MNKIVIITLVSIVLGICIGIFIGNKQKKHENEVGMSHSMENMMSTMNMSLTGKIGDDFDKVFLEQMVIHHEGAINMAELALQSSNRQEIKDLAHAIIDAQTTEIQQMKYWQMSW